MRIFGKHSRWIKAIARGIAWAEGMLFPEGVTCLSCGRAPEREMKSGLCEACARALDALALRQEEIEAQDTRPIHDELAYVHAAFTYQDPAKKLIRMVKYQRIRSAAEPLIQAMALLPSGEEELIVPVPTTKKRLRERGFNQSLLLAQGIGRMLGMEAEDVLERVGEQQEQAGLSREKRLENLHGCMRAKHRLDGKRILLVDDVYTTGATAKEAARALLEAGAASVGVFAAARPLPEEEEPEFLSGGWKKAHKA